MSEVTDSVTTGQETPAPISNQRILWLMAIVAIAGSLATFIFVSPLFGLGIFIGGVLSFINYFWLKATLKRVFIETAGGEHKTRYSATRYFLRYITLGAILGIIFLTKTVSVGAVILGMTSFAFAIMIEASIRIFSGFLNKENKEENKEKEI
jgi:hypothetical protein